jgi:hypothetical protein
MESMRAHFEREAESESDWTSYNSSLGRTLLNTAKFLKKREPKTAAAAAGLSATDSMDAVSAATDSGISPDKKADNQALSSSDDTP